ncbi:MAG: ABC transporter substrate-binding protein [Desulfatiglans sp.]|nr:ABC transporter substrate-binding protein [Thermodesulfobacteriota bacterium]MEE4351859.1 ABC transporter substrate-binding protein [Desulfatiglans sp.]
MAKLCKTALTLALSSMLMTLLWCVHANAASEVPETVKIKIGGVLTLSGPGASWHLPGAKCEISYFKDINKKGGIPYTEPDGTKHRFMIDHKYEDCSYNPQKAVISYGRLRDWGAQLITTDGSSPAAAINAQCARDKLPVVNKWAVLADPVNYAENLDNQYLLADAPTDVTATMMIFAALKRGVWDKKHPGKPFRVGVIAFDNPPRRLYKAKGVKEAYAKAGLELVGVAIVPIAVTDVSVQLMRLYKAGARAICVDHIASGAKVVIENAIRMGIRDELLIVGWFNTLRELLADPEIFDGVYNPWVLPCYYTDNVNPSTKACAEFYLNEDRDFWEYRVDNALNAQHALMVGLTGIKNCLEKYGYNGFTGERLRDTLFNLKVVDTGLHPKFAIDPIFPVMQSYLYMYQLDAKKKWYNQIGPIVAPGPNPFHPRWNPSDDPKVVLTKFYQWP